MKRILIIILMATTLTTWAQSGANGERKAKRGKHQTEKAAQKSEHYNIGVIPTPQQVVLGKGLCIIGSQAYYNDLEDSAYVARFPKQHQEQVTNGQTSPVIKYYRTVDKIAGATNQQEAYRIDVLPDRIIITSTSDEGQKLAGMTLFMMRGHFHDSIPCMTVTDWPAYRWRGWMDDISRGPITNPQLAHEQYLLLSQRVKMNYYTYYTEHTLYNRDYPDIAPPNDLPRRYTHQMLMANLQCFGHFEETLKIPFYDNIKDSPFNIDPSKEESYTLLRSQIANTLKQYPKAQFFNINCDETESLGSGHAKAYVEQHGADEVYCQHINRVYDMVQEEYRKQHSTGKGIDVLMWGDIVAKNPAMLKQLPRDMNYIVWAYGAQDSYAAMIEPFRELHEAQGNPFWVAPGVSHWSSTPQVDNYIRNIAYLARDGHKAGAIGLMNTAWDDSGESLFGDCWHAMYWAAEMAWHPLTETDPVKAEAELKERERLFNEIYNEWFVDNFLYGWECGTERAFPAQTPKNYTGMIYAVGALNHDSDVGEWFNTSALMQPLLDFYPESVDEATLERCQRVDNKVRSVLSTIDSAALPHFAYACHRILTVSEKSRLRVMVYRLLHKNDQATATEVDQLAKRYFQDLHNLKREYLRLWDMEASSYGRDVICDRYDHLGREVMALDRHVFVFVADGANTNSEANIVEMRTLFNDRPIYYTLDGSEPDSSLTRYEGPFPLERSATIKAIAYNDYGEGLVSEQYLLSHLAMSAKIKLQTRYSDYKTIYSAGGPEGLIDGQLGSRDTYADGRWQGYWGDSIDAIIDFGAPKTIHQVSMRFMQNTFDWILSPTTIKVYASNDGKKWALLADKHFHMDPRDTGMRLKHYTVSLGTPDGATDYRYLRVVVPNPGPLPHWHPAPGQPSYLFTDEIVVN